MAVVNTFRPICTTRSRQGSKIDICSHVDFLHSSNEPAELVQWHCQYDSTIIKQW